MAIISTPPSHLYKYRSLNDSSREFTRRLLTHNEVFFAKPSQLNDPREVQVSVQAIGDSNESASGCVSLLREGSIPLELTRDLVDAVQKHSGTVPPELWDEFTENATMEFREMRDGWGIFSVSERYDINPLWASYADSHRGICIEFRSDTHEYFEPWPVIYTDSSVTWNPMREEAARAIDRWIRTKHSDWTAE